MGPDLGTPRTRPQVPQGSAREGGPFYEVINVCIFVRFEACDKLLSSEGTPTLPVGSLWDP